MPSLMERFYGAFRGFCEPALTANLGGNRGSNSSWDRAADWANFDHRKERYDLLGAFAEQTAYRDVAGWPQQYRATYGLSEGIRDLFGVFHQVVEFGVSHIQGGDLDPKAGDGKDVPSALPVVMEVEKLPVREALSELWKRNNYQIQKDVSVRYGVALGDVFWRVLDDDESETIRLNVLPPNWVKCCDLSTEGNVAAYELEYERPDPRWNPFREPIDAVRPSDVRYNERVEPAPNGGGTRFRTYLDGNLFAWPGNPGSDWAVTDLTFAPLVKVQHKNIGLEWGQAEAMAALSGMREVADLASCLTDWARIAIFAPHLMAGVRNPDLDPVAVAKAARLTPTLAQQRSGYPSDPDANGYSQSQAEAPARTRMRFIYTNDNAARAYSLVHPLPVADIGGQVDRLREKNREDYPELSFERIRASGDASAEAIREARKPAEAKIRARRVEHDGGAVRAFKMALTYGGLRGYRHYESFNADSYDAGELDFSIGNRPAFASDPAEEIALRQARYASMKAALEAGLPLSLAMREAGYSDEDIAVAEKARADAEAKAMALAKTQFTVSEKLPTP